MDEGGSVDVNSIRMSPKAVIKDGDVEVFCVKFSPDSQFLAAGCGDGVIRIFGTSTGRLLYTLNANLRIAEKIQSTHQLPCTGLRFRPQMANSKTKNVLVTASSDGKVQHWHVTSGKCLHTVMEEDNQVYAIDYKRDGSQFATAGQDFAVRIYDEATKTRIATLKGGNGTVCAGHSNRIFSCRYNPSNENILVTGGWDNTVQIWDTRVDHAVRSIFGPHICGDAVDMVDNTIVTGSWRPKDQLQTWDFGSGELIETLQWDQPPVKDKEPCLLYATQLSKGNKGTLIASGGSGSNECKVFDRTSGKCIGAMERLRKGVFSVDFSPDNSVLAIATDNTIRLVDVNQLVVRDLERQRTF